MVRSHPRLTMNWLPKLVPPVVVQKTVDPAKSSPRVTAGSQNPYTPKGHKPRAPHVPADQLVPHPPAAASHPPGAPRPHPPGGAPHPPPGAAPRRPQSFEDPTSTYGVAPAHNSKAKAYPGGSQTAREHVLQHASSASSVQRSAVSARAAASTAASPRSMMSASELSAEKRKGMERLLDNYQTTFARETLLSEQYDAELVNVKNQLAKVVAGTPPNRITAELAHAERTKAKLERRVGGFEEKLNELDTYNEKLVAMISGLRKQREPHLQSVKHTAFELGRLATEMNLLKAACHKALDERERSVDMLRRAQEESIRDAADFEAHRQALKLESDELDSSIKDTEAILEGKSEKVKRVQCRAMRESRRQREKYEVRFGYLRSQLEGLENDFGKLQSIVGVRMDPQNPQPKEIIQTFAEKERRVASLQTYWELQNDEIHQMQHEVHHMERKAERAAEVSAAHDARINGTQGKQLSLADEEMGMAKALTQFDLVCERIGVMFLLCDCDKEPTAGAFLASKGCSTSTILEYMSCLSSAIDDASRHAKALRDAARSHRSSASRKTNESIAGFLRGPSSVAAAAAAAQALAAGAPDGAPVDVTDASAEARRQLIEELPSLKDMGPDEGDGDDSGQKGRTTRKGSIDTEKRDVAIASWVVRQQAVREAKGVGNTREYYSERKWTPALEDPMPGPQALR